MLGLLTGAAKKIRDNLTLPPSLAVNESHVDSEQLSATRSINTYVYVDGNPLGKIDILGLEGSCPANMRQEGNRCVLDPSLNNNKECVTIECVAGLAPVPSPPPPFTPATKCEAACSLAIGKACAYGGKAPGWWKVPVIVACEVGVEATCHAYCNKVFCEGDK